MKSYAAYLFDMDGTVTQTFAPWMQIVEETLAQYGIVADKKTIIRKVFGNAVNGLRELGVPEEDFPKIRNTWNKKASKLMLDVELYPGIGQLLALIKQKGKKLALITATARPTVDIILETQNLKSTFDVTISGDEMTAHKPDPGSILTALDKLGVGKEGAVAISKGVCYRETYAEARKATWALKARYSLYVCQ